MKSERKLRFQSILIAVTSVVLFLLVSAACLMTFFPSIPKKLGILQSYDTPESFCQKLETKRSELKDFLEPYTWSAVIVILKEERKVELWADGKMLGKYDMLNTDCPPGTRLADTDPRLPEGIYSLKALDPNAGAGYLAIEADYPNDFDRQNLVAAGNPEKILEGTFVIHGRLPNESANVMLENKALEELFYTAEKIHDLKRVTIIPAPRDLRVKPDPVLSGPDAPPWYPDLCRVLRNTLNLTAKKVQ